MIPFSVNKEQQKKGEKWEEMTMETKNYQANEQRKTCSNHSLNCFGMLKMREISSTLA